MRVKKRKAICVVLLLVLTLAAITLCTFALEGKLSFIGIDNDDYDEDEADFEENQIDLYDQSYLIRKKYETFLFMGTDYSGNEEAEGDAYQGSLSDFLMLLIINHTDDSYALLPIDRNTIVDVTLMRKDGSGEETAQEQICTAHWYGGSKELSCENTVAAVSDYLGGLVIDGYYALSMSKISLINHALGGVTVTLTDDFSEKDPEMKPGAALTLTDQQAEIYLRGRMEVADGSNKNRMERQRVYLQEAIKKLKSNMKEDTGYFKRVKKEISEAATSSITGKQSGRAANALLKYEDLGIFDIEGETKVGQILGDGEDHEEFYPFPDSVIKVMTSLYELEPYEEE
ncbi:MAG: LCP family protein [Eubacterium sp.]|nr:LCP family protein [Eubacterium sp.]